MARVFEFLRPNFVGWDTAPGAAAYTAAWPADFPPTNQDPELALQVTGVTVVATPAVIGLRRIILSFQGPGPSFVDWAIIPSVGQLPAVGAGSARRFEFHAGLQTATVGSLFKESLPTDLLLLPGHRLRVSFETPQVGDALGFVALRGSLVSARL